MNYNKMLTANLSRKRRLIAKIAVVCSFCFSCTGFAGPAEDTKEAGKLYQQGKLDQALSKVNGALAQQPKDAQGRFLKGLILTDQRKIADARLLVAGPMRH